MDRRSPTPTIRYLCFRCKRAITRPCTAVRDVTEVLHQSPPLVQHARGDGENAETTTTTTNESSPSREPRSLRHRYIEVVPVLLHAQQGAIFRDALRGIIARVGDGTRRTHQEKHDGFILERRHRRRRGDAVAVGDSAERGAERAAARRAVPGAGSGRRERDVRAVRRRQTDSSASPDALRALRAAAVRRASVGAALAYRRRRRRFTSRDGPSSRCVAV